MQSILVIENNSSILDNLIEFFELEGYIMFSAATLIKGIELAGNCIPDLIICDNPRPGIDGYEVLRLLLGVPRTSQIPFIFCSTDTAMLSQSEAFKLGADDYIIKPFELENILKVAGACIKAGSKRQKCIA